MAFSEAEVVAVEGYFYHILAANGSGEHALKHIFGPFALAKNPLEGRLHALKVGWKTRRAPVRIIFQLAWVPDVQTFKLQALVHHA